MGIRGRPPKFSDRDALLAEVTASSVEEVAARHGVHHTTVRRTLGPDCPFRPSGGLPALSDAEAVAAEVAASSVAAVAAKHGVSRSTVYNTVHRAGVSLAGGFATEEELRADAAAMTAVGIAAKYKVNPTTVRNRLARYGIRPVPGRPGVTAAQSRVQAERDARIVRLVVEDGMTLARAAARFKLSRQRVQQIVSGRFGPIPPGSGPARRARVEARDAEIVRLAREGLTIRAIAARQGVSRQTVGEVLTAAKVCTRKRSKDWTGHPFGRLTVIGRAPAVPYRGMLVYCRCSCTGRIRPEPYLLKNLRSGGIKSCGCLWREYTAYMKEQPPHARTAPWVSV